MEGNLLNRNAHENISFCVCSNRVAAITQSIMHNLNHYQLTHLQSAGWGFCHLLQATLKGASVVSLIWVGSSLGLSVSTTPQTVKFSLYEDRAIAQISTPVDPGEATPAPEISPAPETSPAPEPSPQPEISPTPPIDNSSPQPLPTSPSPQPTLQTTPNPTPLPAQPPIVPTPTPTTTPTNSAQPTPTVSPTPGLPTPSPSPSVQISPTISPTVIPPVSPSVEVAPTPAPETSSAVQPNAGFPWWIAVGIGGVAIAGAIWVFTRKTKPPEPLDWVAPQSTLPDEPLPSSPTALPAPTIPLSEVKFIPKMDQIGHSTVKTPGALGMNINVAVKLRPDSDSRVTIATKTNPAASVGDRGEPSDFST